MYQFRPQRVQLEGVHFTELSRGSEKDEELDMKGGECASEMNGSKRSRLARYLLCGIVCVAIIVCLAVWLWPKPQLEIVSLDVEMKVQYVQFMGWEYNVLATIGVRNTGNRKGRPHFYLSIPQKDSTESVWGLGEQYELKPNETAHITKELFLGEGSYTLEVLDKDKNPTGLRKRFEVKKPPAPGYEIEDFSVQDEGKTVIIELTLRNTSATVATFLPYLNFTHKSKHYSPTNMGPTSFFFYLAPVEKETTVVRYLVPYEGDHIVTLYGMRIEALDVYGRVTGTWEVDVEEIIREFRTDS